MMFKNRTFSGLCMAVFLMMSGMGMIVAVLPQKIIKLTGSGDGIGLLTSAFAISYILFQIPIGSLADKIGVKLLIVGGYCVCAGAGILYYFAKTPGLVFMGRCIQGLGEIPVWSLVPVVLSMTFSQRKARAIGVYTAMLHIGLAVGPLAGIFLANRLPENGIFLAYAFLCLVGAVIVQVLVKEERKDISCVEIVNMAENIRMVFKIVFSRKLLFFTFAGIIFYGVFYGAFITTVPVFLINIKQLSDSAMGMFFFVFYLSICLSQFFTGPLSDAFGRMKFMIAGLMIAGVGFAAFPVFNAWALIAILGMTALGFGGFYLSSLAWLNEMVLDSQKGTISSIYFLFWGIGYFSGPTLLAWIEKYSGPAHGFYSFSLLIVGTAISLMFYSKNESALQVIRSCSQPKDNVKIK